MERPCPKGLLLEKGKGQVDSVTMLSRESCIPFQLLLGHLKNLMILSFR